MNENQENRGNTSFTQSATNNANVTQIQSSGNVAVNQNNAGTDLATFVSLLSEISNAVKKSDADSDIQKKVLNDIEFLHSQIQKPTPSKNIILDSLENVANIARDVTAISGVVPLILQAAEVVKNIIR